MISKKRWPFTNCVVGIVLFLSCGFLEAQTNNYRLRLIDAETLQPISSQNLLLVPERIKAKGFVASSAPNPNLQYAKSVSTDGNGYLDLPESLILELSNDGKNYVTGTLASSKMFVLSKDPTADKNLRFRVTTYHSDRWVAQLTYLTVGHVNTLLLSSYSGGK